MSERRAIQAKRRELVVAIVISSGLAVLAFGLCIIVANFRAYHIVLGILFNARYDRARWADIAWGIAGLALAARQEAISGEASKR
jgi:hypothetical protein